MVGLFSPRQTRNKDPECEHGLKQSPPPNKNNFIHNNNSFFHITRLSVYVYQCFTSLFFRLHERNKGKVTSIIFLIMITDKI